MSIGSMSQQQFFDSSLLRDHAPTADSWLWLPARAALGDIQALAACLLFGFGTLLIPMVLLSRHLGDYALATSSASFHARRQLSRLAWFASTSQRLLLWRKEWLLLWRDPWLASQTLMQLLYLIPPALMLWRFYGHDQGALIVLVPVLTMAAGQLAGGLAWLAVSGEDAPDLIATAPIAMARVLSISTGRFCALPAGLCRPLAPDDRRRHPGHPDCSPLFDHDPDLVSQPGQAPQFQPPPDLVTPGDLRRGLLRGLLGCRCRYVAEEPATGLGAGDHRHADPVGRTVDAATLI